MFIVIYNNNKEIKSIVEKEDENRYIELFENQKRILKEKIRYLEELKSELQHYIYLTCDIKGLTIKEYTEEYISKTILYFNQNDYNYFGKFINKNTLI